MRLCAIALLIAFASLASSLEIDKGKTLGAPTAPVMMDVFSDFECPACKAFHETVIPQLMRDYVVRGRVCIVSHEFPLDMHKYSREAAYYATAAARLGLYQTVADQLFKTQTSWGASGMVWEAVATALTAEQQKRVQALVKDPTVVSEVQADVKMGQAAGINGTPTVFVTRGSKRSPLTGYTLTNYGLLKTLLDDLLK